MNEKTPQRGEIWMINFSTGKGSEQRSNRPALIIQNNVGNVYAGTTIIAAITSRIKKYPVTVLLAAGTAHLPKDSMVNCSQLFTIDKKRLIKRMGFLETVEMQRVNRAITISLSHSDNPGYKDIR